MPAESPKEPRPSGRSEVVTVVGEDKPPPSSARWAVGDVVGDKYQLVEQLSGGGMGSLWVARNEVLDILVAFKVIRAEVAGVKAARAADRMLQEARATARLRHPAIVRITDFGKLDDTHPYIVMELLDGEDLGDMLGRHPRISPIKALRMLLPIAHALAAAHDKRIVHRDLKPENIFLAKNADGTMQPKLIDFGVAKLEQPKAQRLTGAGVVLGSPEYLSPEQARGDDVDQRADLWSFCVVLYELITGRLPFDGENVLSMLRSVIRDTPASTTSFGVGDDALWAILERGLAKDPDERWQSMRELGAELAQWLIDRDVTDDICGTSLTAAWLQGPRSGDAFESIRPPSWRRTRGADSSGTARAHQSGETLISARRAAGASEPVLPEVVSSEPAPSSKRKLAALTNTVPVLDDAAVARPRGQRLKTMLFYGAYLLAAVAVVAWLASLELSQPQPPAAASAEPTAASPATPPPSETSATSAAAMPTQTAAPSASAPSASASALSTPGPPAASWRRAPRPRSPSAAASRPARAPATPGPGRIRHPKL